MVSEESSLIFSPSPDIQYFVSPSSKAPYPIYHFSYWYIRSQCFNNPLLQHLGRPLDSLLALEYKARQGQEHIIHLHLVDQGEAV